MIGVSIAFGVISAGLLGSAFMAVTTKRLVRSVLWLAVTLFCTAALYVTLEADFLAAMQIILYTGGVITLMLFTVMLTAEVHDTDRESTSSRQVAGGLAAAALFGVIAAVVWGTGFPDAPETSSVTAKAIGTSFLTEHLLAFEALSMLLLGAIIGAIAVARRREP